MDYLINLDHKLFMLINLGLSHPWLDAFFPVYTDLHKTLAFKLIVPPLMIFLYFRKYKKTGLLYFLFCLLTLGLTDWTGALIKNQVERPRPFQTSGLLSYKRSNAGHTSFISNHASNSAAFAAYTIAFFPAAKLIVIPVAVLVAYSRVYNGVHFPLDVICGALWGIAIAILMVRLVKKIRPPQVAS